jgi:hypothetical protein
LKALLIKAYFIGIAIDILNLVLKYRVGDTKQ